MTPFAIARLALAAAIGFSGPAFSAHAGGQPNNCTYVQVATLPVRYAGPSLVPAVDGVIDGTAATMLVDTGADQTYHTMAGAEKRGLILRMTGRHVNGVGGLSRLYSTRLKEFAIGPVRAGNRSYLPVIAETSFTPSYDAIVGASFLLQMDMEISLRDKELKFFTSRGCGDTSLAYWKEDAVAVPFASNFSGSPNPHFMVVVNGQKMDAIIDTGASRSAMTLDAARRAGVRIDAPGVKRLADVAGVGRNRVPHWSAVFETVSIGGETIRSAEMGIIDSHGSADVYLGQDFLRAHRVLFARSQGTLYIAYLGGDAFSRGSGMEPWMLQEAEAGNADAQYRLARIYLLGMGVPKNTTQGKAWLDKSAAQGHPHANLLVGRILMQAGRYPEAVRRMRAALDQVPADRHGALWLYLARVRNGEAELGKRELDAATALYQYHAWPHPIADFYRGRIDASKLLALAGKEPDPKKSSCEAAAHIAEWHAAWGDAESARSTMAARPECRTPAPSTD